MTQGASEKARPSRADQLLAVRCLVLLAVLGGYALLGLLPETRPPSVYHLDWAVHAGAFGALTLVVYWVWPRLALTGLAVLAYSGLLEGLQALAPARTASLADFAANALGVGLALAFLIAVRKLSARPRPGGR